ncbi:MAG: S-methyl-5-thioribose-1-phosphate isomerase [Candidatus Omnitrophica bacterium]|nr:S-methyl-5-thioribose-1-phosphate isomerase [Candidatus Omnitrophota bacterium]
MPVPTIEWKNRKVRIVDQTLLPGKLKFIYCSDVKALWRAIKILQVRGAPAIGIAAAMGVVLGVQDSKAKNFSSFKRDLNKVIKYLATSRPTAVNLFWGLERMRRKAYKNKRLSITRLKKALLSEALDILKEDKVRCRRMGAYGARLVRKGDRILTHCNAGGLATADYGTALGVLFRAHKEGKRIKVYADETRPLLQGARLTAWELKNAGIDVTLLCDDMAASLMNTRGVDKVIVGADRIAANGDAANKIGTYSLAVLARYHRIPFYVVAPSSTFDFDLRSGKEIPIEERGSEEVTQFAGVRTAPKGVKTYCPAFDVTPAELITAIITEEGIFRKPFTKTLKKLKKVVSC